METPAEYGDQETRSCPQMAGAAVTPDQCMQCGVGCAARRSVPEYLLPKPAEDPLGRSHLEQIEEEKAQRGPNERAARKAWGADIPSWVVALARACDESSQRAVAQRLGVSQPPVSEALRARSGKMGSGKVAEAVRKVLLQESETVVVADGPEKETRSSVMRRIGSALTEAGQAFFALAETED